MITWNANTLMKEIMSVIFKGCGKAFKTKVDRSNHKKSHSDEKQHPCPYCKKAYKYFCAMQTHVFKKHPEEYKEENDPTVEE